MEEEIDYGRLEADVRKLKYNLFEAKTPMSTASRLMYLNILRYDLGLLEDRDKVKKVVYNGETKKLEYSESVEIGIAISLAVNDEIREAKEVEIQQNLYKVMQETYYYLARYLFEYFLPAMEFGIPPEKQFIAPRTCILNRVAREMSKFYYREDRPIMTLSMPQGTGKTEVSKRFMSWAIGKDPDLPNMMISYSAAIAKDKFYNGIDALIKDDYGNYGKIFPKLRELYRSGETLSLDYTDEPNRKKPHSEYTLYCVGFDGSVTGRTRAHNILYADDLVKDIEEASNKDIMDKKWIEFTGTIKKRMQGKCKMLLVGTMFSINDPLTRTINYYKEHEPERLIEIRIPGLNENDESNFNYKYGYAITTEMFHEDRNLMDPVSFNCLIQQNPIERAGLLFFEEEFKKFDLSTYKRNEEEYQRTVAYCDVAWGGDDHLSMPIVDEYSNGDCPVIKWIFLQGDKDSTIPEVVNAIITYGVTYICFEANNGGDMYADAVEKELKKKGYTSCYVTSKKAPTNKSKLDRILAAQGFIKGADASEYRMIIPVRESIKEDKQFNEALNEVFSFNQSTAKNVRAKQHDDACFEAGTKVSTIFGDKNIEEIKKGDKIITPFGIDTVEACGKTGKKTTIFKFNTFVTPNHKYFSQNGKFESVDSLTGVPKNGKINLKELILWKYKKLLYSTGSNTNLWGRESIISANQIQMKGENMQKDFMLQCGNIITNKKYLKAIIFIIKMAILLITTFLTWNAYQLGNIYQKKAKKIGKNQNTERKPLNSLKMHLKKRKNGIKVKLEESGIDNTQKSQYYQRQNINTFVKNVEKNIIVQEKQQQNSVVTNVSKETMIEPKEKEIKEVYNLKTRRYGCYYANGNLVSNCDSAAGLGTNVLGVEAKVGRAISQVSREMLGL